MAESQTGIARREFLKRTGRVAAAITTGAVTLDSLTSLTTPADIVPAITRPYWEWASTSNIAIAPEKLANEIKDKFGLRVVGPVTDTPFIKDAFGRTFPTFDWDQPRLTVLSRVLSDLPEHFYRLKSSNGEPKEILLALIDAKANPEQEFKSAGYCYCTEAFYPGVNSNQELLAFDKKSIFNVIPPYINITRGTIVHELTHALTVPEIERYIQSICYPIEITHPVTLQNVFWGETKKGSYVGYGGKNFYEFLAVAADIYYIHGKEYFIKAYEKSLGKERAMTLYEKVREEIFRGKEYK